MRGVDRRADVTGIVFAIQRCPGIAAGFVTVESQEDIALGLKAENEIIEVTLQAFFGLGGWLAAPRALRIAQTH